MGRRKSDKLISKTIIAILIINGLALAINAFQIKRFVKVIYHLELIAMEMAGKDSQ